MNSSMLTTYLKCQKWQVKMLNDIPKRQISLTKLQTQPKKNGFRVKYLVKKKFELGAISFSNFNNVSTISWFWLRRKLFLKAFNARIIYLEIDLRFAIWAISCIAFEQFELKVRHGHIQKRKEKHNCKSESDSKKKLWFVQTHDPDKFYFRINFNRWFCVQPLQNRWKWMDRTRNNPMSTA